MWRNHYSGNFLTDVAAFFCNKVFYTSKYSYTAKYRKGVQMPVGVDIDSCHLEEQIERPMHSVLFLGRLDESKQPHVLLEALGEFAKDGIEFTATFVGGPTDPESTYPGELRERAIELGISERVVFAGPIPNTETYRFYRSHAIYVNCSKSGMLDKSLFKSIACGCAAIFTSKDMTEILGSDFSFADSDISGLSACLKKALALSERARNLVVAEQHEKAIAAHTIEVLGHRLIEAMTL
jgi:glycosyltransferase involved in cell wall biosynthesis